MRRRFKRTSSRRRYVRRVRGVTKGRRRYYKRRAMRRVAKGRIGMPLKKTVKFRYKITSSPLLTLGTGQNVNYRTFRINDLYDMDAALGNTSVPGVKSYSNFYADYLVTGVKFKVTFTQQSGESGCYAGVFCNQFTSAGYNSWQDFVEAGHTQFGNKMTTIASGTTQKTLTLNIAPLRYLQDADPTRNNNWTPIGTSPATSNVLVAVVWLGSASNAGATVATEVAFDARLWVTARLRKRSIITNVGKEGADTEDIAPGGTI